MNSSPDSDERRIDAPPVVLDTNVFVAAGFRPESASAEILGEVRSGGIRMIWSSQTFCETRRVLEKIPRRSWTEAADLFRRQDCYSGEVHEERFEIVADPADRKFAALAAATGAVLISSDSHLTGAGDHRGLTVLSPTEFVAKYLQRGGR